MHRVLAVFLAAWTLVALPAFCIGGWLEHPCACGEPGCGGDGACPEGHGCLDDPCAWQILRARAADGDDSGDPEPCMSCPAIAETLPDSTTLPAIALMPWACNARFFLSVGTDTVGLPLLL